MTEMWTIVLSALLAILAIYNYVFRNFNHFKKRGIPHLSPIPLLGNMAPILFRKKTFAETMSIAYNSNHHARYFGFFDFSSPVVILRDPELIKTVTIKYADNFPDHKMLSDEISDSLFKDSLFGLQGQRWKDARTLLSPSFTSSKMKTLFKLVKECSTNLINHVKERSDGKPEVFDMRDILNRYTNDVIVTSAFGIGVDSLKDPNNDFYRMGTEATDFSGSRSLRLFLLRTFPTLSKLLDIKLFNSRIVNFYKNVVKSTIAVRRANGIVRPDMIQLMMQAKEKNQEFNISDDDMTAHAFIFYFGGFDTAALLASFSVHEIVVNPNVAETLRSEIDEISAQCNGNVTYEALHSMKYLDAVMNETLRLHSPAVIGDRLCRQKFQLPPAEPGLKPLIVEPGDTLWFPFAAIHRDPKYFKNPDEFYPERFLDDNKNEINPDTFLPFGSGPRFCVGNRFALMEAKLVVFELFNNFNLSPCSKTVNPLKISHSSFVPRIEDGVWLSVEPRCPS